MSDAHRPTIRLCSARYHLLVWWVSSDVTAHAPVPDVIGEQTQCSSYSSWVKNKPLKVIQNIARTLWAQLGDSLDATLLWPCAARSHHEALAATWSTNPCRDRARGELMASEGRREVALSSRWRCWGKPDFFLIFSAIIFCKTYSYVPEW